jgi:hypothetical protein
MSPIPIRSFQAAKWQSNTTIKKRRKIFGARKNWFHLDDFEKEVNARIEHALPTTPRRGTV